MEIPDQQHADQKLRVDRGPADRAVKWGEVPAQAVKVEKPVDPAQQVILGNVILKSEPVEELLLLGLPPHHDPIPLAA